MDLVSFCPTCCSVISDRQVTHCEHCGAPHPDGPWPLDPWLGKTVENGRYFVDRMLGRGGFGTVYEVRHTLVEGRILAMKVLNASASSDPEKVKDFLNEIKGLMSLDHPNVVTCYEAGRLSDGTLFVLMEKIDGVELSTLVQPPNQLFSPEQAVDLGLQIARALQAAHEIGLLHRDLKPQNVMLCSNRSVRVLDFGIAKMLNPEAERNHLSRIIGTPLYMAPEQFIAGAPVGPSLDIYQCGAVLHFALTGYSPFEWQDEDGIGFATIIARQHKRTLGPGPRPGERLDRLITDAPGLNQLVGEMLSFRPELRPGSFAEVIQRLETCLSQKISTVPEQQPRAQSLPAQPVASVSSDEQLGKTRTRVEFVPEPAKSATPSTAAEISAPPVEYNASRRTSTLKRLAVVLAILPLLTLISVGLVAFFWEKDPETLFADAEKLRAGEGVKKDVAEAVEQYTLACDKKHRQACIVLADLYVEGDGVRKSKSKAFKFFNKGCRLKHPRACFRVGQMYKEGQGTKKSARRSFSAFKKSCLYKHADGCYSLSRAYSRGHGTKKSPSRHRKTLNKACDLEVFKACHELGLMYIDGRGVKAKPSRARALFEEGCQGKFAAACSRLGLIYYQGDGVSQSNSRARRYFKKGCQLEHAEGCNKLGEIYEQGQGVTVDLVKASSFYDQACDYDSAQGCDRLGVMLDYGHDGIKANPRKARALFEKSCKLEFGSGCSNLGWSYQHSTTLPTDDKKAVRYFREGCELGDSRGCVNVGWMYTNARGVDENLNKGAGYYKQACRMGNRKGCNNLEIVCKQYKSLAVCDN